MHESIDNGAVSRRILKYLFSENGRYRRKHDRKRPTVQHNDDSQMFKFLNFRQKEPNKFAWLSLQLYTETI